VSSVQRQAVARVYAEAIYELAEAGPPAPGGAAVREELESLGRLCRDHPNWATLLETPAIRRDQKLDSLERTLRGRVSDLTFNALRLLASKERLRILPDLVEAFAELDERRAGRTPATITTAVELTGEARQRLAERLSGAVGKNLLCAFRTDGRALAGLVVTYDDTAIDASVRRRLELLGRQLWARLHGEWNSAGALVD